MSKTQVIVPLLAGLAAGAVLGILLAPDNGKLTREKLLEVFDKLGDSVKDIAYDQINELLESFKEKVDKFPSDIGKLKTDVAGLA